MAAEVASQTTEGVGSPHLPRTVSALRSSRSGPKRVPTRVSIVVPKPTTRNDPSPGPDATSSDSTATSSSAVHSPDLSVTSTPWAKKLILTLDGGGIRGYSSLIILRALMKEIADIEQTMEPHAASSAHSDRIAESLIPDHVYRKGDYLPCHYFDYIAGTSMGGLIAIMLGMLGWTADQCIDEFHRQNKSIPLADDLPNVTIDLPLLHRRSTWPTKRTRSFFDTFAKFSATSTAHTLPHRASTATAATSPPAAESAALSHTSSTTSTTAEFKKDTFQCQTLAWCTEVEDRPHHRSRRIPYAFCSYKEEDGDEEEVEGGSQPNTTTLHNHAQHHHARIQHNNTTASTASSTSSLISITEVAKAITNPSTSSFKPFKLGGGQFVDGSKQIKDPTLEVLKEISSLLTTTPSSDDDSDSDSNSDEEDEDVSPTTTTKPKTTKAPVQPKKKKPKPQTNRHHHHRHQPEPPIGLLLSLGTDTHQPWFYEKLRRPTSITILKQQQHDTSTSSTSSTSSSQQAAAISSQKDKSYSRYHRFEVRDIRLGLRKKYFLGHIEDAVANQYLCNPDVRAELREYAAFLVEKRRARAGTSRWEGFALGVRYFCGGGCNSLRGAGEGFESRGDYYQHLERRHGLLRRAAGEAMGAGVEEFIEEELDKGRRFGCS